MTDIVVIITDDEPRERLGAMPTVRAQIRDRGVNYKRGFAPSPLCAIARTSFLTGRYAHETGVWNNGGDNGGWGVFQSHESNTLATALTTKGYRTGLFGKYVNGWAKAFTDLDTGVPPGWDQFKAISPDDGGDGDYYNYSLIGTDQPVHYADTVDDYSTDVLTYQAVKFIEETPSSERLFLYYSPYGAHANYTPAPRHEGAWTDPITLSPAVNASNYGFSPWLQNLPTVDTADVTAKIKSQYETLMSVDDGVAAILGSLAMAGRTDVLFVFLGDNGLQLGEHRLNGKYVPYQASTWLQMLMRHDGVLPENSVSNDPINMVDLTATIVNVAEASMDTSGFPYGNGRLGTLLEGAEHEGRPAYIGWRTPRFMYCEYADGGREFFDYKDDPDELTNVIAQHKHAGRVADFTAWAHAACSPLPPGF